MKPARVVAAVMLVASLALVLAWPVLHAEREIVLHVTQSSAAVHRVQVLSEVHEVSLRAESEIATGVIDRKRWVLVVGTGPRWICHALRVIPGPGQSISCSARKSLSIGGTVAFYSAGVGYGLNRGLVVAALPRSIEELHLRATRNAPIRGRLIRSPEELGEVVYLIVFLPPQTDLVEATAFDASGTPMRLGRLIDLIDAY